MPGLPCRLAERTASQEGLTGGRWCWTVFVFFLEAPLFAEVGRDDNGVPLAFAGCFLNFCRFHFPPLFMEALGIAGRHFTVYDPQFSFSLLCLFPRFSILFRR